MATITQLHQAQTLGSLVVDSLEDHKAEDIISIDLKGKSSIADSMIIATGRSDRHVITLADHVVDALKKAGHKHISVEGKAQGDWVLVDAIDVIVHVFKPEVRSFYNLEKMWAVPMVSEEVHSV